MPLYIGTSGWDYRHWQRVFYPPRTKDKLAYFAERFPTVELNGTFYRLPERRVFRDWYRRTPQDFIFSVKASRYLTHMRRLRRPKEPVRRLLSRARGLGAKMGPILLQLPPSFDVELDWLDETLAALDGLRVTVEFRDERWYVPDVRRALERRDVALCLADRHSRLVTPAWRTADWGYIRFHAGRGSPPGAYGTTSLRARARMLAELFGRRVDVFTYFNNDGYGCALRDAATFGQEAERAGFHVVKAGDVPAQDS